MARNRKKDETEKYQHYFDDAAYGAECVNSSVDFAQNVHSDLVHEELVLIENICSLILIDLLLHRFAKRKEVSFMRREADPKPTVFSLEVIFLQVAYRVLHQRRCTAPRYGEWLALNVDDVHLLTRGPRFIVSKVDLLLNHPCLHPHIFYVVTNFFIRFAVTGLAAFFNSECHGTCTHQAFRTSERHFLAILILFVWTEYHVAVPRFEELLRNFILSKVLLSAPMHVKDSLVFKLVGVDLVPINILLHGYNI